MAIYTHTVRVNVLKDGKPFLLDKHLHSGDWMDPSFEILYPQRAWVDDNVLHFYREEYYRKSKPDALVIANNTKEIVKYLRVISEDMYLLFDLQPASVTSLSVAPPRGDFKWVNFEGEFSEGRSIKRNGGNFTIRKELSGPFTYYIYITEDSSTIESPLLEKYKETN